MNLHGKVISKDLTLRHGDMEATEENKISERV